MWVLSLANESKSCGRKRTRFESGTPEHKAQMTTIPSRSSTCNLSWFEVNFWLISLLSDRFRLIDLLSGRTNRTSFEIAVLYISSDIYHFPRHMSVQICHCTSLRLKYGARGRCCDESGTEQLQLNQSDGVWTGPLLLSKPNSIPFHPLSIQFNQHEKPYPLPNGLISEVDSRRVEMRRRGGNWMVYGVDLHGCISLILPVIRGAHKYRINKSHYTRHLLNMKPT